MPKSEARKAKDREWREANKEKIRAYHEEYRRRNRETLIAKNREWLAKNKEEVYARRKARYLANLDENRAKRRDEYRRNASAYIRRMKEYKKTPEGKEVDRSARLRQHYGITMVEWRAMHAAQGGGCAICRVELKHDKSTHTDHCHSTGMVRGLLCKKCNLGLGYFKDDTARMREAIRYLERSN